ncbi:MAG: hypothetical protein DMG65_15380 [Candidatus Angelobacter sp. Gp1-AA117]|nr:MAG: hypothetical protein DMG65_15380 [Candidatus Angelobacter sp. Gp1-AA117]
MNRREILKGFLAASLASQIQSLGWQNPIQAPSAASRFLTLVNFADEPAYAMETVIGSGLDGRLCTDLAAMEAYTRTTPTEKFYVRTCGSPLLPDAASWRIRIRGPGVQPVNLSLNDLNKKARSCGEHLMECSGNSGVGHFGLISVAQWEGVPLTDVLERAGFGRNRPAKRVLVSGFDHYPAPSATSTPGASWIFSLAELAADQAFLATTMNNEPLTRDHGDPVRLVVPGWYGCACIKWVNEIALVEDSAAATSHMREFAARTHQAGVPRLAREYESAVIDPAAMPVRLEKWMAGDKISYCVLGILWGASRPVGGLEIQFNPHQPFVAVDGFAQDKEDGWNFWTHAWTPSNPGRYTIRLRLKNRMIRTRRLDSGHYRRTVVIHEV